MRREIRAAGCLLITVALVVTVSPATAMVQAGGAGGSPAGTTVPTADARDQAALSTPRIRTLEWTHPAGAEPGMPDPVPRPEVGIGPGSELFIERTDGSTTTCTANFVWTDQHGELYLGTAGHCVLAEDENATHGPNADTDASNVEVQVAVEHCYLQFFFPTDEPADCQLGDGPTATPLGGVAYANRIDTRDFALIEIPDALVPHVRTDVPRWGSFQGEVGGTDPGDSVGYYGHGIAYGSTPATRGRAGVSFDGHPLRPDAAAWAAQGPVSGGDSGSPVVTLEPGGNALQAESALGIVTHGVGVAVALPTGPVAGPQVAAIEHSVLCNTGLAIHVVPGGEPTRSCRSTCDPVGPDPRPGLFHLLEPPGVCTQRPEDGGWTRSQASSFPLVSDTPAIWSHTVEEARAVAQVNATFWIRVHEETAYLDIPLLDPLGEIPFQLGAHVNGEFQDAQGVDPGIPGAPGVLEPGVYELDFPAIELPDGLEPGDELELYFHSATSATWLDPSIEMLGGTEEHDTRFTLSSGS